MFSGYRGIFTLYFLQLSSSANHFAPSWICPMKLCFLRDNLKHSPAENNGKQDENKMETIPGYSLTSCILFFSYGVIQYVDSSLWFVGLMAFRTYTIRVVAVNENGEGMSTREMTTKTYSDKPSEPPQNATLETASSTVRI